MLDKLSNNLKLIISLTKISSLVFLISILVLNILFEAFSISLLIPFLKSITDINFYNDFINHKTFFDLEKILLFFGISTRNQFIIFLSLVFLFFFIARVLVNILTIWSIGKFKFKLHDVISKKMLKGYLNLPYLKLSQKNSAKSINNVTNEVDILSNNIVDIIQIISESFLTIALISILLIFHTNVTIILLPAILFLGLIFMYFTNYILRDFGKKRQIFAKETNKNIIEIFRAIKEIKILNKKDFFYNKFSKIYERFLKIFWYKSIFPVLPRAIFEIFAILILAGSFIYSFNKNLILGEFLVSVSLFVAVGYRLLPSINKLIIYYQKLVFGKPAGDLVFRELKEINSLVSNEDNNNSKVNFKKNIKIENLIFSYSEKKIINNLNLNIDKNSFVGIFGESGSGKSTLIKIITGLIYPSSGDIMIDNEKLNNQNINNWRKKIGYVPQDPMLLDDTILNNIAFGYEREKIDLTRIDKVIEMVELKDFINSLPNKINTLTGESGNLISGGQAQRICIARALYSNPELLILDESTNSLDEENENKIILALKKNLKSLTVLIISHRSSTIMNCDKIFQFQNKTIEQIKDFKRK